MFKKPTEPWSKWPTYSVIGVSLEFIPLIVHLGIFQIEPPKSWSQKKKKKVARLILWGKSIRMNFPKSDRMNSLEISKHCCELPHNTSTGAGSGFVVPSAPHPLLKRQRK